MDMPALRTIHWHTLIPQLIVLPGQPVVDEVAENISACLTTLAEIISSQHNAILHQVLMFDKIKIEAHPQWDDCTNYIQSVCCEHAKSES